MAEERRRLDKKKVPRRSFKSLHLPFRLIDDWAAIIRFSCYSSYIEIDFYSLIHLLLYLFTCWKFSLGARTTFHVGVSSSSAENLDIKH